MSCWFTCTNFSFYEWCTIATFHKWWNWDCPVPNRSIESTSSRWIWCLPLPITLEYYGMMFAQLCSHFLMVIWKVLTILTLCLFPNSWNSQNVSEYWLITLCTIITRVLANKLKKLLRSVNLSEQGIWLYWMRISCCYVDKTWVCWETER